MRHMTLKQIIMRDEGLTSDQADKRLEQARRDIMERIECGELSFDFMEEEFGLEPDYLDDLLL